MKSPLYRRSTHTGKYRAISLKQQSAVGKYSQKKYRASSLKRQSAVGKYTQRKYRATVFEIRLSNLPARKLQN